MTALARPYLPVLGVAAFVPLPPIAPPLPQSPADLKLPDHFGDLPVLIHPFTTSAEELAWRVLVALRAHKEWAAIHSGLFVADLVQEDRRTDSAQKVCDSFLTGSPPPDRVDVRKIVRAFSNALLALNSAGHLACSRFGAEFWPTPLLLTKTGTLSSLHPRESS